MTISLSLARLRELLDRAQGKRVVVIGDAMLDIYLSGEVERISPEAPVPVVLVRERTYALGGACNVAQNVVAIGAECSLVAGIGADRGGETIAAMLGALGIASEPLVRLRRPTTQKTRIVARSQQLVRIDEEEDADLAADEVARLLEAVRSAMPGADALVFEDYNKGVLTTQVIAETLAMATARGIPVVVDPKFKNFFSFRNATVFKPNRRELEAALGAAVDIDHPETLPATVRRLGVANILLTLGERGMVLFSSDGKVTRIPTMARQVYDVVGAGDTVTAYLATMLAAGADVSEAAYVANVAAGVEVGKLGACSVTREEILQAMSPSAS